jgi:hypothetical protein
MWAVVAFRHHRRLAADLRERVRCNSRWDTMSNDTIIWTQGGIAEVPLQRFTGRIGAIEVATVEYDGSNRLWTWWSPLAEDIWGHAQEPDEAKQAAELWLRNWLENFRPFFEAAR